MSVYALCSVALVCVASLVALVLVLRHLAAMRATDSEIVELRKQWTEGSAGIAASAKTLDDRLTSLNDGLIRLQNRLGNTR